MTGLIIALDAIAVLIPLWMIYDRIRDISINLARIADHLESED